MAATVVYGDTEFAPGDWTEQVFYTSGNGGTGSAIQLPGGGNPGACRRVTHNIGGRPAQVALAHEFAGATYDPQSQGAINEIGFSFDARTFSDPGYLGQSASLTIRQGGVVYCGPFFNNGTGAWVNTTHSGLVASNFKPFDGTLVHPDFSSSGGMIQFGFVSSNTNPANGFIGATSTAVEYDNWSVTIDQVPTGIANGSTPRVLHHAAMPNPFEHDTQILFTLEEVAAVRIELFDVRGRSVRRFEASRREAGAHSLRWDGRDARGRRATAGVYFYRIHADQRVATGRVTLVR